MGNPSYRKGVKAEYREMEKLRKLGYTYISRSAGSHGVWDVCGIDVATKTIRFVQVKTGKKAEAERAKSPIGVLTGEYHVEGLTA